jgi:hypothetical protein
MTVDELIYKRLMGQEKVTKLLTRYCNEAAVFFQSVPDDNDENWISASSQYPRIEFMTSIESHPERQTIGQLSIDVLCTAMGTLPEEIEPLIRDSMENVFFSPDDGDVFSIGWTKTDNFEQQRDKDSPLIYGKTLLFDITEFPCMETSDPDPVAAMNRYANQWDANVTIIGKSEMPEFFTPTRDNPAAYFRKVSSDIDRQTNTVVWMNAVLAVHFFAPSLNDRIEWLEQFSQQMAFDGEVIMLDNSPMFIQGIKGDAAASEQDGQIKISVQYGLLRRPKYAHTMMTMKLNQEGAKKNG